MVYIRTILKINIFQNFGILFLVRTIDGVGHVLIDNKLIGIVSSRAFFVLRATLATFHYFPSQNYVFSLFVTSYSSI